MSKIQKIDLSLGQRIASQFKTTRCSSSNPFKFQDFEGNTIEPLLSADVLVKSTEKKKLITSSVAGSMEKIRSFIPESITAFVNRVVDKASNFWNYAKNTNVSDLTGVKTISNTLNMDIVDIGKNISSSIHDSISGIGKSISDRMSFLNTDVTDLGKILDEKWSALVHSKAGNIRITKNTTVDELRTMLEAELAKSYKEAA